MMTTPRERENGSTYRLKRLQRGCEYTLLATVHLFFVISFDEFIEWWMAIALAVSVFGMNLQLTQLRERRRTRSREDRARILADTFESILLLLFIVILSIGGAVKRWLG